MGHVVFLYVQLYKFNNPENSCVYRQHNAIKLKSLKPTEKNTQQNKKKTIIGSRRLTDESGYTI